MKHLKNLEKLLLTLIEQRTDIELRADWEAKEGSVGAASNLIDERDKLNECIESLEWVVDVVRFANEIKGDYERKVDAINNLSESRDNTASIIRLNSKKMCYEQIVEDLQRILQP